MALAHPPIPLPDQWTLGDLERMRLVLRGGSVIDWRRLHFQTREEVDRYLRLCLFEPDDPFDRARLQRILDEAVDYLRTTFRYAVAEAVAHPAQLQDLFLLASGVGGLRRVISDVVDLDAAADAFARIRAGRVLKIVVRP